MKNNRYCVIMAGGVGTRFWPISRAGKPKQFLDILNTGKTFIQNTFDRFSELVPAENFLVVTNAAYKDIVLEQLPLLKEHQVLLEPVGRNTAPCIAYAAFRLKAADPDALMIVTPSDHLVLDAGTFRSVVSEAADFAEKNDSLVTIGVKPTRPATGYGYIQVSKPVNQKGINKVRTFTEKPNRELARLFLDSGEFFWNSGIFIWKTDIILRALKEYLPEIHQSFASIGQHYNTPSEQEHIDGIYPECRAISIDYGVMEKAANVHMRAGEFGWSDIGTWGSLYQHAQKDEWGNTDEGNTFTFDTHNCVIKVPAHKIAVLEGLDDYIVVDTDDVLMVCPKNNEQNVKKYMDSIRFAKGNDFI